MIAAELVSTHRFRLTEMPREDPAPGEVQVRVAAVGICGSDLHYYSEGAVGDTPCVFPMVMGHEPSGTVVKCGAGVTGWQPGDRAVLEPALYCYHCEFCRAGHHNVCANIRFLSTPGYPGFFREYVNLPGRESAGHSHNDVSRIGDAGGAPGRGAALHALRRAEAEDTVAVIGAGPIGLLTVACAKLAGAKRIYAVDPVEHRRGLALRLGADVAFDPADLAEIAKDTAGRGVDCAIDCAAKAHTTNDAIRAVRNAGRVVITGIHSETHVRFEMSPMRRKELSVFNVRRSNHETHAALETMTARPEWFAPLVTHARPMEQIDEAFAIAEGYLDGVGKMVVKP